MTVNRECHAEQALALTTRQQFAQQRYVAQRAVNGISRRDGTVQGQLTLRDVVAPVEGQADLRTKSDTIGDVPTRANALEREFDFLELDAAVLQLAHQAANRTAR